MGQPVLQVTVVAMAQPQVVGQVAGAVLPGGGHRRQGGCELGFGGLQVGTQGPELLHDVLAFGLVPGVDGLPPGALVLV